ncbi:hypothetical protein [Neptunicella sp. SCSIO 80796]|uniref:hypothetical protein n=1 Tax=Neptunicella plasticusilytica TaxID=3117012 RepID=UPI003A4DFED2
MALIKCHECKNQISSTAKTCPQCGAKNKPQTTTTTKIFAVLFAVIIVYWVTSAPSVPTTRTTSTTSTQTATPKPKAPPTIDEKIKKQFSAWDGSHYGLEKIIKKSMNDPDSYKHIETRYVKEDNDILVITEFSGKNAFNATVKNSIAGKFTFDGQLLEIIQ